MNSELEKLLIVKLSGGDEKAFRKLLDTYRHVIYAYSFNLLKSSENANEIVQDVFMRVWLNKETLNPNLSFKSYVFTIARNLCFDFLKKATNNLKLREDIFYRSQNLHSPIDRKLREEECKLIKNQAVNSLTPKQKLIFTMSRENDKSYIEISDELGISVSTVKNQMSKSLSTIRSVLRATGILSLLIVVFFSF